MNHAGAEARSYPPAVPTATRPRDEALPTWVAVAVIVGLAVVLLAVTSWAGGYGLPRNDDWSYSDLLWRWQETGHLRLAGWESMTLVGQLLLAWPLAAMFGRDAGSLQLFTVTIGAVGALAAFGALRRFVSSARALLAVGLTMTSPLYAPLAVSFMTDVPAFAVQSVCAWMGVRAIDTDGPTRRWWFVASVAVGLFGVTIREYAVVAPAAVVIVFVLQSWGRRDRSSTRTGVAAAVVSTAFVALFIGWRRTWAASLSLQPSMPTSVSDAAGSFGRSTLFTVATIAFLVLPAFAFAPVRQLVRRLTAARWSLVAVASTTIVLLAGAISTWEWSPPLLGPYLDQRGALGNDILPGNRALLLPGPVLRAALLLALAATVLLVGLLVVECVDRLHRASTWRDRCASIDPRALAWLLVVLTVLSLTAAGTSSLPIFDRYVLPAVPFAAGLVLGVQPVRGGLSDRTPQNLARWASVVVFVLAGLLWTVDSAHFDRARWSAGERAVALGYPADRVDAGFEWRNVHRPAGAAPMSPTQRAPEPCVLVTAPQADPARGAVQLFTIDYGHGVLGSETLTAWTLDAPDCPPLP
jgi:hypothetical protein